MTQTVRTAIRSGKSRKSGVRVDIAAANADSDLELLVPFCDQWLTRRSSRRHHRLLLRHRPEHQRHQKRADADAPGADIEPNVAAKAVVDEAAGQGARP